MRYLVIILFLLLSVCGFAQTNPSGNPSQLSTGWFRHGWDQSDSGLIIATRVPSFTPRFPGTTVLYQQNGIDSNLHYWNGARWIKLLTTVTPIAVTWGSIGGTLSDQTDLQNALNLKLNISDTTNKWISNIRRLPGSLNVEIYKNGAWSTAYQDSIGSGGVGTVTSVGLSMPSAFNVTPGSITSSGVFNVTGAGTTAQYIRGNGTLATTDSGMIPNFYLKVRGLFSGTSPITYNSTTGAIGIPNGNTTGTKGAVSFNNGSFSDNGAGLISLNQPVPSGSCTNCNITWGTDGRPTAYSTGSGGSGAGVDTLYRIPGIDSLYFTINSVQRSVKDSAGANYSAGNGIDITGNIISQLYIPFKTGTPVVGNSISNGCCPDGTYTAWWDTLGTAFIGAPSVSNLSISGMGVRRGAYQLFTNFGESHQNTPIAFEVGFNNTRILTDTATHYSTIQSAYRSMIASQFLIHIEGPNWGASGTNPNVTYSTAAAPASSEDTLLNWQSRLYWFRHNTVNTGANWFNKASCNNDTITIASMIGSNLAFGTFGYYNTVGSRIKINIDGVDVVTYDPNSRTYTGQAEGFSPDGIIPDAIIVTGLTNISHTVKIIFIDNGKRGALDWFGSMCSAQESYDRPAYILAFPHMNATGYSYPGGETNQGILDSATVGLKNMLKEVFPGYAMSFVDINAAGFYNPNDPDQIDGDGIHPTSQGQFNWAKAAYATMLKSDRGRIGQDLDETLANGFTSARRIVLTTPNTTAANMEVGGDLMAQVFANSNSWIASNLYYNGSDFVYKHNGVGAQLYFNSGYIEEKTASSGTAGGTATINTRKVVTPAGDVFLGGDISNSLTGTGAKMLINGTTSNITVPGVYAVGPTAYSLGAPNMDWAVGPQPGRTWYYATAGTDEKYWDATAGTNSLKFRIANDAYLLTTDWLTVTRTGYTYAQAFFGGGEVNIGDATDQGSYTLQNTGGLYQNGVFLLRPLSAPPSTYNVLVHGLTDSIVYQVPLSSFGATTIYNGNGTLAADRNVSSGGFTLRVEGANNSDTLMSIINTGTSSVGAYVYGTAVGANVQSTGTAIVAFGTTRGLQVGSSTDEAILAQSDGTRAAKFITASTSSNTVSEILNMQKVVSSGTGADGIGAAFTLSAENTSGAQVTTAQFVGKLTTATNGAENSQVAIVGVNNSATQTQLTLDFNGALQLNQYGTGSFTGTPTFTLQSTSSGNIIEGPLVSSGTWSPTLTNGANSSGASLGSARYSRIGNIVTFAFTFTTTTSSGATATSVSATLPIASNFTVGNQASGTNCGLTGNVVADFSNDVLSINWVSGTGGSESITVVGQYIIL